IHRSADQSLSPVVLVFFQHTRDEADGDRLTLEIPYVPSAAELRARLGFDRHGQHFGFTRIEVAARQIVGARPAVGRLPIVAPSAVPQRLRGVGRDAVRQVPDQRPRYRPLGRFEVGWSDPHMHAVDTPIGHLDDFGADYAVVLRRDAAEADTGAHGLADG